MTPVKNTSTQNITSLTYKATGINNSAKTISKAMTSLYFGIDQWGIMNLGEIQNRLSDKDITLDTYVAFDGGPGVGRLVDTAGNILELYG